MSYGWYLGPSPITLNTVDGGGSNENLVAYMLDDLHCSAAVVVNEVKRAQMLLAPGPGRAGCPNTIFRLHDNAPNAGIKNDDGAYANHAPEPFADARWTLAPESAFIYGDNEPNSANLEAQNVWNQRFIAELMRLNQTHYGTDKKRWKRPAIHAQSTLHPTQGIEGLKKYATSVRDLKAAEGMIIPHLYYYRSFEQELAKGRGSFAVIEEWRQLYGDDFPMLLSEFSFADGYQRTAGPRGATGIGIDRFLDDTCETAEYLARFRIYIAVYGTFPANSEWEPFNMLYEPVFLAGIANWNREHPMSNPTADWQSFNWGEEILNQEVQLTAEINVRNEPNANSIDAGDLKGGEVVSRWANSLPKTSVQNPDKRYEWVKLRILGIGIKYAAKVGGLDFKTVTSPTEPPPTVPPPFPDNITEADNLRLIFKGFEVAGDQLKALGIQGQEWLERWMDRNGDTD